MAEIKSETLDEAAAARKELDEARAAYAAAIQRLTVAKARVAALGAERGRGRPPTDGGSRQARVRDAKREARNVIRAAREEERIAVSKLSADSRGVDAFEALRRRELRDLDDAMRQATTAEERDRIMDRMRELGATEDRSRETPEQARAVLRQRRLARLTMHAAALLERAPALRTAWQEEQDARGDRLEQTPDAVMRETEEALVLLAERVATA